jgi:hypothetical protein
MLVNKLGVLNCVFLHMFTNLSLSFSTILSVLRNILKDVFSSQPWLGGGVEDAGGAVREAMLAVCVWCG